MTAYEGNSFSVKFNQSGARVLVDPWLVSDLTFFDQTWAYRGRKRVLGPGRLNVDDVAAETDVILLSQYLDDHTHMPTLERLPKSIPIIAQPEAAARIAPLGFTNVTPLAPGGALLACGGALRVTATGGALVGPPWSARQNGFVLAEQGVPRPASLYYEPHCDFDEASVAAAGPVDVVVSPVVDVLLGGYALVRGGSDLAKLLRLLRPSVLVPLLNAELDEEGGLTAWMSRRGEVDGVRDALAAAGLGGVDVDMPAPPGEAFAIAL
ncbi:MAG: beta-lactamase superfamily domain-containing protein [Monoraphidium minutum]|nr:MAG: beta-lactamase superfamily domain-containing protein [Monoraphidium minutum]